MLPSYDSGYPAPEIDPHQDQLPDSTRAFCSSFPSPLVINFSSSSGRGPVSPDTHPKSDGRERQGTAGTTTSVTDSYVSIYHAPPHTNFRLVFFSPRLDNVIILCAYDHMIICAYYDHMRMCHGHSRYRGTGEALL